MATVAITGGTGLIGTALTQELIKRGYQVIILTRNPSHTHPLKGVSYASWDPERQSIDEEAIRKAGFIVHLAGASVAEGRWTEKRKQEIIDSRVKSGDLLVKALNEIPNAVKAVLSSSAIGYYGPDPAVPNPKPFVETDSPSNDFLGTVVQQWEAAISPVSSLNKRLVIFRTGIVLSSEGGAYAEFKNPMKFGLATILGSGKQVISWIHIDDLVRLYIDAMEQEKWNGIYNAVAPSPVSNSRLILTMKKELTSFSIAAPVPAFILKLMLGEMSIEVLKSTTVSAAKVFNNGYLFMFSTIEAAVKNLR